MLWIYSATKLFCLLSMLDNDAQTVMGLARAALFVMAVLALGFAQPVGPDLSDLWIPDDILLSDCGCLWGYGSLKLVTATMVELSGLGLKL